LAAKLTLLGDVRGASWLDSTRMQWREHLAEGKVKEAAFASMRVRPYTQAYERCLAQYTIDRATGNLALRERHDTGFH
jgi:hypothetical protein